MPYTRWPALSVLVLLVGCSTLQYNLPGVSQNTDGRHLPGKVIWHDLLSDTPERTKTFYNELFGWQFEPLPGGETNYTLIRHQGRLIGGMVDQNRLPAREDVSQWVVVISVADVERATATASGAGGAVITAPTSLGDRGHIAIVADNQGAVVALLQTRDGDPLDDPPIPATGSFLWDELLASDPQAAGDFYRETVGYSVAERQTDAGEHRVGYRVLSSGGFPRVGLRERPVSEMRPTWLSYLRVADVAELDAVLARVESLGGQVLVPATERPAGGRLAVIAGPSGAGIALQTWGDEQRLSSAGEVTP